MRCLLGVVLSASMLLASAVAQDGRLLTHPPLPNPASLAKAGLKRQWFAYVPMDGARDRIEILSPMQGG